MIEYDTTSASIVMLTQKKSEQVRRGMKYQAEGVHAIDMK